MHEIKRGAWRDGMGEEAPRRTEWPELLGEDAGRAEKVILRDEPKMNPVVVRPEDENARIVASTREEDNTVGVCWGGGLFFGGRRKVYSNP